MTIKREGSAYRLYTKDGSRPLGPKTSKAKAERQERAIEASKHRKEAWGKSGK